MGVVTCHYWRDFHDAAKSGLPARLFKDGGQSASERVQGTADAATQKITDAAANVQEVAGQVVEQAREYAEQAQEGLKNFKPFVEKSIKEQPMATLAVAALIGAALGALWKK